ncbi:hypothetical protein HYZ98_05350, partial [Candidatus Peregrinibacteria bacterium]|nr:hypothetical protein [Candidatus Peregrinibacteria bacterium]
SGLPYRAEDDGRGQLIVVPLGEGSTGSRGVGVTTESPATSEQTPATPSKAPDVSKPDESTKQEAASDTSKEAPSNVPVEIPANLDGSLHEKFKTLDSAEQQIVTQALTFIEFKDDVHHNQLHLISALTKMDASHRDQIAKQIDQLGKIPDEEAAAGIQKALQNAGLNAQEGHVLAVLIQHHREVFRAPQGEPNAPGEEAVGEVPDKQSLATEAARLHGLPANRINDIRRAGFLLSLAFKGIDISDKENIFSGNPDALKMCRKDDKMWNIIAGLVEVAMALKGEQSDEEKKKESEKEKEKIVAKLERGNKFIQSQTDDQVGIDSDSATGPKKEGNNRYWIGIDGDTNDLRVQFNAETSRWEMKEEDATTWWNPGVDSRPDEWSGSGLAAIKRIENGLKSINEDNEA